MLKSTASLHWWMLEAKPSDEFSFQQESIIVNLPFQEISGQSECTSPHLQIIQICYLLSLARPLIVPGDSIFKVCINKPDKTGLSLLVIL